MAERFFLYYITDRAAFAGDERQRRVRLLDKIAEAASQGVDYIQLREKDLCGRDLELLAREAMRIIHEDSQTRSWLSRTSLLINSRTDVARARAAAGVHLRGDDGSARDIRAAWRNSADGGSSDPIISVACHSAGGVDRAAAEGVTFAVFAPVFEKKDAPESSPTGLEGLRKACGAKIPVLALGGVNLENAESCRRVGAAGIAGIRLFQENDIGDVVRALRS